MAKLDLGKVVPIKGEDYFTNSEIEEIKNDIEQEIKVPTKTSDLTNDSGFIDNTVNNLTNYTLGINTGHTIDLSIDSSTYVMTLDLKNSAGTIISTDTVDLPLESVVVSGTYDSTNKKIVLTLQSGSTIDIPVGDLVSGLQSEITSNNKLSSDLVDDTNNTNKFVTSSEKQAWNNKSDFSGSYEDLSNKPTIPDELADLQSDSTHRTVTDAEKTTWNGKQDVMQYSIMPTASANTVGKVIQFVGTTDSNYTNGYFYKGISTTEGNETTYSWSNIGVQDLSGKQNVLTFDNTPTQNSTNPVTSNGIFQALAGAGGGLDYTILNDWEGYINIATCEPIIYIPKDVGSNSTFRVYIDENRTYAKSYDLSYLSSSYVQLISITKVKEIDWNSSASGKNVFAYVDYYHMKNGQFRRDYYYRLNSEKTARIEDVTLVNGLLNQYVPSTISEKYTFDTLPETSVTPTTDNQFVNKSYVDAQIQTLRNELSGE